MTWFADDVVKVEVRFDGSTWVNLSSPTNYVILSEPLQIERGRDDEFADPMNPGVLELLLVNDDGRFTPDLPTSPYYPYVVPDVAIKVSVYVNSAWQTRFYGSVQSWSVRLGDEGGYTSTCAVTATDTLGDFPEYTLWQASAQAVRSTSRSASITPDYYWPRLDADGSSSSLFGTGVLVDNGVSATLGTMRLPLDEGDYHAQFTSASGGRKLTATISPVLDLYRVSIVISKPSTSSTVLELAIASGSYGVAWTGSALTYNGLSVSVPSTATWPCVVGVRSWVSGPTKYTRLDVVDSAGWSDYLDSTDSGYGLKKITVNPTLSGGATWSAGHLVVAVRATSWASVLLAPRVPASVTAAAQLSTWAGGPTISGGTVGASTLPQIAERDAADALSALAIGTGARIRDNLDGTLQWIEFTPSTTPIAMPSEKVSPDITWETTTVGWMSDCTVSWPDGTSYTSTRGDGRRASYSIEGVHATTSKDRSYADWLVNTASTKARLSQAAYDVSSLSASDQATVAGVKIGDRITIGSLPSAILPASLTLIVEGITDLIGDDGWTVTLKTSPDVYSRLLIWDNAQNWDDGWIWAP